MLHKIKQERKGGVETNGETEEDTLDRVVKEDFPGKLGFEWGINKVIEQAITFWTVKCYVYILFCEVSLNLFRIWVSEEGSRLIFWNKETK